MKYKATAKALDKFSKFAIQRAQLELGATRTIRGRKVRRVASGTLQKSLFSKTFVKRGKVTIGFGSTVNYADFIEQGVDGTKEKHGSPYSFKKKNIARGVLDDWVKKKRIRPRDKDGQFIEATESNVNSMKFMIGRAIARDGIVPLPFMQMGVEAALKKYDKLILEGIEIDLDNELDL